MAQANVMFGQNQSLLASYYTEGKAASILHMGQNPPLSIICCKISSCQTRDYRSGKKICTQLVRNTDLLTMKIYSSQQCQHFSLNVILSGLDRKISYSLNCTQGVIVSRLWVHNPAPFLPTTTCWKKSKNKLGEPVFKISLNRRDKIKFTLKHFNGSATELNLHPNDCLNV